MKTLQVLVNKAFLVALKPKEIETQVLQNGPRCAIALFR